MNLFLQYEVYLCKNLINVDIIYLLFKMKMYRDNFQIIFSFFRLLSLSIDVFIASSVWNTSHFKTISTYRFT